MDEKMIYLRCDDKAEVAVFTRWGLQLANGHRTNYYEISIEDSYCGPCQFSGLLGRLKRAWCAFTAKPIYYNSVCIQGDERVEKFLRECLSVVEESHVPDV